jgi:uncharacterized protein YlxP (DUF503 family)
MDSTTLTLTRNIQDAGKLNRDALAIVKKHKFVIMLAKALNADDKARAKVGAAIVKGDITSTRQAVDMAHRAERAIESLGILPKANGLRMSFGVELDAECFDAFTRKELERILEACATIRTTHATSKEAKAKKVDEEVQLIKAEDAAELASANG